MPVGRAHDRPSDSDVYAGSVEKIKTIHEKLAMTRLDRIMFDSGFVRTSVVAEALGVSISTVLRRIDRAHYSGERSGQFWYVKIDDIYNASDTSETQRERLKLAISEIEYAGTLVAVFAKEQARGPR